MLIVDMIKNTCLYIVFLLSLVNLQASTVPNFIAEDINGESHDLYSYLDDGKVVILDVFATWCTGCWTNHQQNKLSNLYKTYGPEGTNELMILFVEGDAKTPDAALFEDNPFGDWTENVPYPIFNPDQIDTTFLQAFASNGVPTTNVICPSSRENIADIFDSYLEEIILTIQECKSISNVVDLQIIGERAVIKPVCLNTDITFEVLNTGTELIETFTVTASESSGLLIDEYTFNGKLLPGERILVDLGDFSLPNVLDNQIVNILIETQDDVTINNMQIIDYTRAPEVQNELMLRIRSDFWSKNDNTRWWIENSANQIVTPINHISPLSEKEYSFTLENNDCFTFVIAEDFGDGMVLGEIVLYDDQGNVLYDNANFGERGEGSFEYLGSIATSSAILSENQYRLDLFPNTVISDLNIQYQINAQHSNNLSIFNVQGQRMYFSTIPESNSFGTTSVNVQDFPPGIYFVRLANIQRVLTEKFIKQ